MKKQCLCIIFAVILLLSTNVNVKIVLANDEMDSKVTSTENEYERLLYDLVDNSITKSHNDYLRVIDNQLVSPQSKIEPTLTNYNGNGLAVLADSSKWKYAPDLHVLSTAYTITIYDKTYHSGLQSYPYRIIYVVDNKGRNGLINHTEFNAIPKYNSFMQKIATYVFKNGATELAGTLIGNPLASWTLGTIFEFLDGVQDSTMIQSTSDPLYRIIISSQTMMRYVYLCVDNTWRLIDSSAYTRFIQTNVFAGTVGGKIVHETATNSWSNNTCHDEKISIKEYLKHKTTNPQYHIVGRIGSLKLESPLTTKEYYPPFYELPGFIH